MADNVTFQSATPATPPDATVIATDDAGLSGHVQIVKLAQSANGSATPITADADGLLVNLGVNNDVVASDGGGSLTVDNGGTFAVQENGAALTSLQLIDDSVHADDVAWVAGDKGVAMMAVRNDFIGGTLSEANGDYVPLLVDAGGSLQVRITNDSGSPVEVSGTITAIDGGLSMTVDDGGGSLTADLASEVIEDGVALNGAKSVLIAGVRNDTAATKTSADGDYGNIALDDAGRVGITDLGGAISVDDNGSTLSVDDGGGNLSIDDGGNSITVDGTVAVSAVTSITNVVHVDDNSSTLSIDDGAGSITVDGTVTANTQPSTSGGLAIGRSLDLDETKMLVKGSAGQLYGWYITNRAASPRYIKLYDAASTAAVTVGTTTPVMTLEIPGNSTDHIAANALGAMGIAFSSGIVAAATTGLLDSDTGAPSANDVVVNFFYK